MLPVSPPPFKGPGLSSRDHPPADLGQDLPEERTRGSRPGQQPHPDPQGSSDDSRAPGRRPPQPPVHLSAQPSQVRSPASWGPQPGESADAPLGLGPSTAPLAFQSPLATIETFEFYEWTRKAFAVVTTG